MPGLFDDIPSAGNAQTGGLFDDLPDAGSPNMGFGTRMAREDQAGPMASTTESTLRGLKQGFLGNFGDELSALSAASPIPGQNPNSTIPTFNAVDALAGGARMLSDKLGLTGGGGLKAYDAMLERQRAADQAASQANPGTYTLGSIGGMLANPLGRFAPAAGLKQGAVTGATIGAIYGAGDGTDMESRAKDALTGGLVGGALGGVVGKIIGGRTPGAGGGGGGHATVNTVVEAGERAGVDVPRFLATDSKGLQAAAQAARQAPIGGGAIENAVQGFKGQVGEAAERAAQSVGSGNAMLAGETARGGLANAIDALQSKTGKLYDRIDALVRPDVLTPLQATQEAVSRIASRRQSAALDGSGKAVDTVLDAITRAEGLTYEGVKNLRTSVGEMMKPGMLPQGVSQGELKQIYGALTTDLESAVGNAGGKEGLTAWRRANEYAAAARSRQDRLVKIIGAEGANAGEKVFDRLAAMAGINGRADARTLQLARKSMQPDEWNELASGVIQRLGRASPDAEFSADRFMTQWSNMSNEGKSLIFGGQGTLRQSLDDIATLSERMKKAEQFSNRSNTGRAVGLQALVGSGAGAIAGTVAWNDPSQIPVMIGLALGGRMAGNILSKPATAAATARFAKVYASAVQKPAKVATSIIQRATTQYAATISKELGIPQAANDIGGKLLGGPFRSVALNGEVEPPKER